MVIAGSTIKSNCHGAGASQHKDQENKRRGGQLVDARALVSAEMVQAQPRDSAPPHGYVDNTPPHLPSLALRWQDKRMSLPLVLLKRRIRVERVTLSVSAPLFLRAAQARYQLRATEQTNNTMCRVPHTRHGQSHLNQDPIDCLQPHTQGHCHVWSCDSSSH